MSESEEIVINAGSRYILSVVESKRELLGMSKAELGRRVGLDAVTMGTTLRGTRTMTADEAMRICACLNIDPSELMSPEIRKLHADYWGRSKR